MSYLARVETDAATAQRIMDALAETLDTEEAATALVAEPDGRWAVELTFSHAPDADAVRDLVAQVAGAGLAHAVTFSTIRERDWVKASLAGLQPVTAGRFVIHGRHDRDRIGPNRMAIEVEAALAFGTGHHATTRGCLIALDALVKQSKRPRSTLDIGTGTGVLAIAAAKVLRTPVLASDIDFTAVKTARENARLNAAAALIDVVQGARLTAPRIRARAPYDLVLANILLAPLKQLAASMARVVRPGARVVLSGLLTRQANAAIAAYRAHGLALERRIELDGWTTLVLVRPAWRGLSAR